jgi:hypothetical protein
MIPGYLTRFAELYERQGRRVEVMDDKFWVNYNRVIVPIGPITIDYSISEEQAHLLMKMIPGSLMVRYTNGYKATSFEEWYAVTCDEFRDMGTFRHNRRRCIKKGLENCDIRQLDAGFIAKYGYDVYLSAFSRYQGVIKAMERKNYENMINTTLDFDDIYNYWGGFFKGKLIGYIVIAIYGDEGALMSAAKFAPEYFKYHLSDALFYTISQHYLQDKLLPYLDAGFKNIYHKTTIQEYMIKKFSFKKTYLNLRVTYNPILNYFLKVTFPLRGWLSKVHHDWGSIYMLEEIRRKCESKMGIITTF